MQIYIGYTNNYARAVEFLNSARKEKIAALLSDSKTLAQCKGLDLQSLLIMPVQRVPRYTLLIQVRHSRERGSNSTVRCHVDASDDIAGSPALATMALTRKVRAATAKVHRLQLPRGPVPGRGAGQDAGVRVGHQRRHPQTGTLGLARLHCGRAASRGRRERCSYRVQEANSVVVKVQEEFSGDVVFVTPTGRRLIHRGPLSEIVDGKGKPFYCFLFDDLIVLAEASGGAGRTLQEVADGQCVSGA